MIEHRLIEKMIEIIKRKIPEINKAGTVDPVFVDTAVDFIRMYADRTHHGKEEDILFRACVKKDMSPEDATIMNELIEEHKFGRKTVANIVEAKNKYLKGEDTINAILEQFNVLVEFYPKHIRKEDAVFFPNVEKYFTEAELQGMLEEFWEFDRLMIHHKYKLVVEELRNKNC